MMDVVIEKGKADLVSMSRPLIKEPDIINRWMSGDKTPSDCTSCNGCLDLLLEGEPVKCIIE
jgi:2,4-dienoyl-CoA reductase-like NADH-dependent reductase (Old Yellow Enzyme family)